MDSVGGHAQRLTVDHTAVCAAEAARVQAAGGELLFAGCWRVISASPAPPPPGITRPIAAGHVIRSALAVTRALGDAAFKRPERHVIATPDVLRLPLSPRLRFVLLATDGVWDVLSDQMACDVAGAALRKAAAAGEVGEPLARSAAEAVTQAALSKGTADNVTAAVIMPLW
jgi:protein phosphatase 2C